MKTANLLIRSIEPADWGWILSEAQPIGGAQVVSQGALHTLNEHGGFIAEAGGVPTGFAIYRVETDSSSAELLAIRSLTQWQGIGSALMSHTENYLARQGVRTIWLCTTNDNVDALRFYQQRGFRLSRLVVDAFTEVRRLKGLPLEGVITGSYGIPICDEIVLTKSIDVNSS